MAPTIVLAKLLYETPSRGDKRQKTTLCEIIKKRVRDGVNEHQNPKYQCELDRLLRSICTKLDKGNVGMKQE